MSAASLPFVLIVLIAAPLYSILPKAPRFWLLLAVSLAFYGSFNWKFLVLLVGVIAATYLGGLALHTWRSARWQLALWVLAVMAPLLFYKYLIVWFDQLRLSVLPISDLKFGGYGEVLIPVGLSFFTFQSLAYLIDVARGYYEAERNSAKVGLFIAFFPQLLAGPIERWPHLAPQLFEGKRPSPDMVLDGLVLVAYGLFMKLVLGDSLGVYVDAVYAEPAKNASATAWLGIIGFTGQLYADFCGYSLIAIGSALLFGIRVINNFKQPFFARSIVEFWQRWHISLTRWIGDYVYRPLALRSIKLTWLPRHGQEAITLLITWVVMGLWHGANWTFVVFGLTQAVLLFGYTVWSRKRRGKPARARAVAGWALTFVAVVVTFGLIRAPSVDAYLDLLAAAGAFTPGILPFISGWSILFALGVVLCVDLVQYVRPDYFKWGWQAGTRAAVTGSLILLVVLIGHDDGKAFIYFRF